MSKRFGATQALDDVSLEIGPGEVHALVGENGAGKSTLMNVLAGSLAPDAGRLELDGEAYAPKGPIDAREHGVAMVHQEPMLCPDLSVLDNVLLGVEPTRLGFIDRSAARERAQQALALVARGASPRLEPNRSAAELSSSERQLVTIARALAQSRCRLLILDEPTSSLTKDDADKLFEIVADLERTGVSIVYISHFLEEVERVADRYTVLRDGKWVGSGATGEVQRSDLIRMMVGREIRELFPRSERHAGNVVLDVSGLSSGSKLVRGTLQLRAGEVFGIAGLMGSGRTELLRSVFGLDRIRSGELRLKGYVGPYSPARRWAQGVGIVSEDRKHEGLAEQQSIAENLTLTRLDSLGPRGLVLPQHMATTTRRWIDELKIRCRGPWHRVAQLSGGNQQKVAIARLLHHDADIYLLDEPTRGIDVQSRAELYSIIDRLANEGKSVLLVSSYLPELMGICDRIAVMSRGKLGSAHDVESVDEHSLLLEAVGG